MSINPIEPISTLTDLITQLSSTIVHETYFPYLWFPVIHALRVSIVWASLTSSRSRTRSGSGSESRSGSGSGSSKVGNVSLEGKWRVEEQGVGVLQDLFGYLVMCWGGSTLVSILQSQPPLWLISPTPWQIYIPIYILTTTTGLSTLLSRIPGIQILGAYIDGLTRGSTVCAITSISSTTTQQHQLPILGRGILSIIGTCGGGWIVQSLGLDKVNWEVGVPAVLQSQNQGLLGLLDIWAAGFGSLIYSALLDIGSPHVHKSPKGTNINIGTFNQYIPQQVITRIDSLGISSPSHAKTVVIIFMASLFFARVITKTYIDTIGTRSSSRIGSRSNGIKTKTQLKKDKMSAKGKSAGGDEIQELLDQIQQEEKDRETKSGGNTPRKKKGGNVVTSTGSTPRKSVVSK